MNYFVVKYSGPFGFIKPWTAVRDSETFSQQFLTPSIIEGIEKKLFPDMLNRQGIHKIVRHRLSYQQLEAQQEQIQTRGWNRKKINKRPAWIRGQSILSRSVLLAPSLILAFKTEADARNAAGQHICLCRNEDILLPESIAKVPQADFDGDTDSFAGFELMFERTEQAFLVGYNRFQEGAPMYGWLKVVGNPLNQNR